MAGITFITTPNLSELFDFYHNVIGMRRWLSQPDVEILQHGNFLLGLHEQPNPSDEKGFLLTFFYETKEEVDQMYSKLGELVLSIPKINEKYQIYNFFARDPHRNKLEFQTFLNTVPHTWS